jgi:hypothetical protein
VVWLTGNSFLYSLHIGIFQFQSRPVSSLATIEIKKESQIGDGFSSGQVEQFLPELPQNSLRHGIGVPISQLAIYRADDRYRTDDR